MNDIVISENDFDLSIENGDFFEEECTTQHLQMLILANKGEFRETPQAGVGIVDYINSKANTIATLKREIQVQCDLDEFEPTEIAINLPNVTIKGTY